MNRDIRVFIDDILESIEKLVKYTKGISLDGFLSDSLVQDAVIRRLEIIGEAVKKIPENIKKSIQQSPGNRLLV